MSCLCIGHRGASGHAPENTLKAFQLAIDMGCPWLELDVYAVADELLVIHDDDVDRTTNGSGEVMSMSLAELRKLDAGDGEKIPTLREVLELCAARVSVNVELKGPETAEATNRLLNEAIDNGWDAKQFAISSFDHRQLAKADPQFARGALFYKEANYVEIATNLSAFSINVSGKLVSQKLVDEAHDNGFQIWVYTVNTFEQMKALVDMGVDGIFTNFPDRFPN